MGVATRQAERQCKPIICGDQMDLRVPAAARFTDGLWAVFLRRAGTVGMHLDAGAIQSEAINGYADHMVLLQDLEEAVEHTRIGPTMHPGINRVTLSKMFGQCAPFVIILGEKEDRVDRGQLRNADIPALNRQVWTDKCVLLFCYLNYNKYLEGICIG